MLVSNPGSCLPLECSQDRMSRFGSKADIGARWWISVTAGGVEHEREHTGQLTQAAARKPRVPARTKFPTPRPCGPPNFSVTILVDRSRVVGTRQIRLQSLQRTLSPFTHSPTGTLPVRMGESCDWSHRNDASLSVLRAITRMLATVLRSSVTT